MQLLNVYPFYQARPMEAACQYDLGLAGDWPSYQSRLQQQAMLLTSAGQHIQHMQKARTQMNIELQHVFSDLTDMTGMTIIRATLAGERDLGPLARLRD